MLKFINATKEQAEADLTGLLEETLQSNSVLLLLSGGSNIEAGVRVVRNLPVELRKRLTITLVDERYGKPGHDASNMAALERSGLPTDIRTIPVLIGEDMPTTAQKFESAYLSARAEKGKTIALLGIGADGHIAGLLPHSTVLDNKDTVVFYNGPDHQRISLSLEALKQLDDAYVFAFGEAKVPALTRLYQQSVSIEEQPSQILYALPSARVYNELQIGGENT